jgi:hypothetical protein
VELDRNQQLEAVLEQINLCSVFIQEIHTNLEQPETPDEKADLLIAVESLTKDVYKLLHTTKGLVWGEEPTEE